MNIVEPDLIYVRPKFKLDHCKKIKFEIKRHVDGVRQVDIQENAICSFCKQPWNIAGLPGCCNEAQEEFYKENL